MDAPIKEETQQQLENSRVPWQLRPWQFKRGQSGNPGGRPKGSISLKEYAKKYLRELNDDEKLAFMEGIDKTDIWKLAEGNPDSKNEMVATITMSDILKAAENAKRSKPIIGQELEVKQPLPDTGQTEKSDNLSAQQSPTALQPEQVDKKPDTQEPTTGI